jgi:hypothetical protein
MSEAEHNLRHIAVYERLIAEAKMKMSNSQERNPNLVNELEGYKSALFQLKAIALLGGQNIDSTSNISTQISNTIDEHKALTLESKLKDSSAALYADLQKKKKKEFEGA